MLVCPTLGMHSSMCTKDCSGHFVATTGARASEETAVRCKQECQSNQKLKMMRLLWLTISHVCVLCGVGVHQGLNFVQRVSGVSSMSSTAPACPRV
jgi:hypothetical protein